MAAVDLDQNSLKEAIESDKLVLVDFWGDHCPPCKMFAPVYDKVSERYPDAIFGKVHTNEHQQLAAGFGIRAVPTIMVFREGVLLMNQEGALPEKALEDIITQANALDMDEVRAEIEKQQKAQGGN